MNINILTNTVIRGDNAPLRLAIKNGYLGDKQNLVVRNLLINAVEVSNLEAVKLMADHGIDLDIFNSTGTTLLHYAVDEDMIRYLVSRGLDVNASNHGSYCPIHACAEKGFLDFKALVEAGADINALTGGGSTPLILAARSKAEGAPAVVKALIEMGCRTDVISDDGTAMKWAIASDNSKTVEAMLDMGLTLVDRGDNDLSEFYYAIIKSASAVVDMLIARGADLQEPHQKYGTPIHLACSLIKPDFNVMRSLILAGADTEALNKERLKPDRNLLGASDSVAAEQHYQDYIRERAALVAAASFGNTEGLTRKVKHI